MAAAVAVPSLQELKPAPESDRIAAWLVAGQYRQALAWLQAHGEMRRGQDDFDTLLAAVAMKAEAWPVAVEVLEPLVARHPEAAGAWLDLAIAKHGLGEQAVADELFVHIEENLAPSPALQQLIARYRQVPASAARPGRLRGYLALTAGHDSNANAGIMASNLPITIGNLTTELPVAPESQSRGDSFQQVSGFLGGEQGLGDIAQAAWSVAARLKHYQHETSFSTQSMKADLNLTRPILTDRFAALSGVLLGSLQQVSFGSSGSLRSSRLGGGMNIGLASCRLRLAAERESRRYSVARQLDGDIDWLSGDVACPGEFPLNVWLRRGADHPRGVDRAGGDTARIEAGITASHALNARLRGEITLVSASAKDDMGYSPLLEFNAQRRLRWENLYLAAHWHIDGRLYALISAEILRQQSNLAIFEQRNKSLSVGLAWSY